MIHNQEDIIKSMDDRAIIDFFYVKATTGQSKHYKKVIPVEIHGNYLFARVLGDGSYTFKQFIIDKIVSIRQTKENFVDHEFAPKKLIVNGKELK